MWKTNKRCRFGSREDETERDERCCAAVRRNGGCRRRPTPTEKRRGEEREEHKRCRFMLQPKIFKPVIMVPPVGPRFEPVKRHHENWTKNGAVQGITNRNLHLWRLGLGFRSSSQFLSSSSSQLSTNRPMGTIK